MVAIKSSFSPQILQVFQIFFYEIFGWKIDIDVKTFHVRISRVIEEVGCVTLDALLYNIQNKTYDDRFLQAFAREFSVDESYFFRDISFFDHLIQKILPQIIDKKEYRLNIWSVGCSQGEEAYSVAMTLHRHIADIQNWDLHILATDINPDVLKLAKDGLFTERSFRKISDVYMKAYFKPVGNMHAIDPAIKKMVHFRYHNINTETQSCLPPNGKGFDLILFKNVLIYMAEEKGKRAVANLFSMLNEGGCLATTSTEYNNEVFNFTHSHCTSDKWIIQKPYTSEHTLLFPTTEEEPIQDFLVFEDENSAYAPLDEVTNILLQAEHMSETAQRPLDEDLHFLHYHDALKLLASDEIQKAKDALIRSIYCDSGFVVAYIALGNILLKEGKHKASMKYINKAKTMLHGMQPEEQIPLSGGMIANDLLMMVNTIKEENFG